MEKMRMCAPCLLGLEGLVADELRRMDALNVQAENGRVVFEGDSNMLARANIRLRYGERVLILAVMGEVKSFEELFELTKAYPWEQFIGKSDKFPVNGHCLDSKLASVPDCQKIIKKAIVSRLSEKYNISWFEETGSLYQIRFLIHKNRASIMIDTSGAGLHKRGYRAISNDAPIKETLAAAMADLSRVRSFHQVYDPMCGSGTILIEAAMKALNIAPGLNRDFISQGWGMIPQMVWEEERAKSREAIIKDCEFMGFGSDIDQNALKIAKSNAQKAGVGKHLRFERADVADFLTSSERGSVITNPPYGERLLDISGAEEIYRALGKVFTRKPGWSYTVISPDDNFEVYFGRKADKRRKLYNGMIPCQVYMYFK